MPTDQEILEDAYYIRDLVNYSDQTKELTKIFFQLLRTESAITSRENGDGFKKTKIRDRDGIVVDTDTVLFDERDYQRRSGMVEGFEWLEDTINALIEKADEEDVRKKKEKVEE